MNQKAILVERFKLSKDFNEHLVIASEHIQLSYEIAISETYDIKIPPPGHEIWRNVNGWEGIYQISSFGRIKALERFFVKKNSRSLGLKAVYQHEKIRSVRLNPNGYCTISFWIEGKPIHKLVHRLVALHFIDNPNNYKQVGHLDNNPANAKWDNLEWGTQKMNIQYAVKCGRWHTGQKNYQTKLKDSDIPKIRELLKSGLSSRKIAAQFDIDKHAILSIKNNKTWKHIK